VNVVDVPGGLSPGAIHHTAGAAGSGVVVGGRPIGRVPFAGLSARDEAEQRSSTHQRADEPGSGWCAHERDGRN
jgi:hypothetical protein